MKYIKYVFYFLLALLAIFIIYGIYFAVMAYFIVIKFIVIALAITGMVALFNKKVKKDID